MLANMGFERSPLGMKNSAEGGGRSGGEYIVQTEACHLTVGPLGESVTGVPSLRVRSSSFVEMARDIGGQCRIGGVSSCRIYPRPDPLPSEAKRFPFQPLPEV